MEKKRDADGFQFLETYPRHSRGMFVDTEVNRQLPLKVFKSLERYTQKQFSARGILLLDLRVSAAFKSTSMKRH